jgi:hypothetical protein
MEIYDSGPRRSENKPPHPRYHVLAQHADSYPIQYTQGLVAEFGSIIMHAIPF